jgi:DNA-binding transcriptional LysR family regulator
MIEMISKIWTPSSKRRRRRALDSIRRQIESSGYALDDLTDSELEAAITRGEGGIEEALPLTGKKIYWTLRRLSPDDRQLQQRKIKQPPRTQRADYF